jgi:protein required for attachment to host cells
MDNTWVLVADRARARVFALAPQDQALTEIECFVDPQGRDPGELPPRGESPLTGGDKHAIEPRKMPDQVQAQRFAHMISAYLDQRCKAHDFEQLVVVAAPRFLGLLNAQFGSDLTRHVSLEIDKDYTMLSPAAIQAHLPASLH